MEGPEPEKIVEAAFKGLLTPQVSTGLLQLNR